MEKNCQRPEQREGDLWWERSTWAKRNLQTQDIAFHSKLNPFVLEEDMVSHSNWSCATMKQEFSIGIYSHFYSRQRFEIPLFRQGNGQTVAMRNKDYSVEGLGFMIGLKELSILKVSKWRYRRIKLLSIHIQSGTQPEKERKLIKQKDDQHHNRWVRKKVILKN